MSKGPRALGLLELAPSGAAHLVPVTIMYNGDFYDASAYKASPVPMALESETVYEAVKTGVSQGLFTVTTASQVKDSWIGNGVWRPAGSEPKKKIVAAKPVQDDSDKPPVLRHADEEKSSVPAPKPTQPAAPPAASSSAPKPAAAAPAAAAQQDQDDDRPVLRRGKPEPRPEEVISPVEPETATAAVPAAASKPGEVQIIPAISDAGGPEPRPYAYSLKPDEEQSLKKQMFALAADAVRVRDQQLDAEMATTQPATAKPRGPKKIARKPLQPAFSNVEFRVFDLSNSNEPVLVLCATAQMPIDAEAPRAPIQYFVTLVARQTIYGELHKAFINITDGQHLDALPHMELIDAVDADGDGRGELLFRDVYDSGTAYAVYRVIGDQLWPLFQGTPQ